MNSPELHPLNKLDGHFNTISRIKFSIYNPLPEQISIIDIAHGLAFNSHFGGQTPEFFSIAQHSILVSDLIPNDIAMQKPGLKLMALMHDAAEAYIGDMIKPLKVHFPEFKIIENNIMDAIAKRFNLQLAYMSYIKEFDLQAQAIEYNQFYKDQYSISYLNPEEAKALFIYRFNKLYSNE